MNQYLIGIAILAAGAFVQSCTYIPLNMVRHWSWESFSFVKGIFLYLLLPLWVCYQALPEGYIFYELFSEVPNWQLFATIAMGMLWGIGILLYDRCMLFFGEERGNAYATATAGTLGVLLAAVILHSLFFHTHPQWELSPVVVGTMAVAWIGFLLIGKAGELKSLETESFANDERNRLSAAKGWMVVLLTGLLAGCFNGGLTMGDGIYLPETLAVYQMLPSLFLLCIGAFIANTVACLCQNFRNHTFADYSEREVWKINILIAILVAAMEFAPFYALSLARAFFKTTPAMVLYAPFVLLMLQTVFAYPWKFLMQEWRGTSFSTRRILLLGVLVLLFAVFLPALLVWIL